MAAAVGNQYALGNNGGRPPIYDDPIVLDKQCEEYFKYVKGEWDSDKEDWSRKPEPITITGLALFLGFSGRKVLHDYESKDEFSYIIKRAMARVEQSYEFGLHFQNCTGSIFALKNMGWKDKTETEHSGELAIKQITGMVVV